MQTFIIVVLTADGLIAEHSNQASVDWTSKEDKRFFSQRTKQARVVVMGLNTYKTIGRPLPERLNIVYSNTEESIPGVEITRSNPVDLLRDLEKRGYNEAAIIGGAQIYTMFMKASLIDKLYLTVEPVIFGSGIKLFNKGMNFNLRLESFKKIGDNTLLLEYNVIR